MTRRIEVIAVEGVARGYPGDDVAAGLGAALAGAGPPQAGDVLVVTHKILSKAQGRTVLLSTLNPSPEAEELAHSTCKDPAVVEAVLSESRRIVRHCPGVIIAEHRLGMVMANAGIDRSNVSGAGGEVLMLPEDPDGDAVAIRAVLEARFGVPLGVVIADSVGRAWRNGVTGMAIGAAGLPALIDLRGRADLDGRPLEVTEVGLADQIASAAELVMGEADESCPAALVRGVSWRGPDRPAADLIRDPTMDLFR